MKGSLLLIIRPPSLPLTSSLGLPRTMSVCVCRSERELLTANRGGGVVALEGALLLMMMVRQERERVTGRKETESGIKQEREARKDIIATRQHSDCFKVRF